MHDEGYYTKYPRQWWSLVQWTQFGVFTLNTEYITWLALLPNYSDCRWISELPTPKKKKTEKTKKQTETKRHPKLRLQKFRDSRVGIFARQVSTSHQAVEKCLQETSHNNSNNDNNEELKASRSPRRFTYANVVTVFVFGHLKLPRNVWHVCVS